MKLTTLFFAATLSTTAVFGQDFKSQFKDLCAKNDTAGQLKLLRAWEAKSPNDADFFISYFNYTYERSRQSYVALKDQPTGKDGFTLSDSTNHPVAFLGEQVVFDEEIANDGLNMIEKGIKLFPDRLDMRFGKVYVLGNGTLPGVYTGNCGHRQLFGAKQKCVVLDRQRKSQRREGYAARQPADVCPGFV